MRDGVEMTAVCLNCRRHEGLNPARVSVPTEQAYFKLCGVDWREPRERR
jgi:hypothetical protein